MTSLDPGDGPLGGASKCCASCKQVLAADAFATIRKTGKLHSYCKSCRREKREEWRKSNPDKQRQAAKRRYDQNPERFREKTRQWRADNPEYAEKNRQKWSEYGTRWREENPEKWRDRELRRTYGITLDEYKELLEAQHGACAICGDPCPSGKKLAVDHDHETGRVRGLLCILHNQGIGQFRDDPDLLLEGAKYLLSARNVIGEPCEPQLWPR